MPNPIYGQGGTTRVGLVDQFLPGMAIQTILTKPAINLGGAAAQVLIVTLPTPVINTLYSISVNGQVASFTTGATTSFALARAQLLSALGSIPEISGNFALSTSGADSVVLTAIQKGVTYPYVVTGVGGVGTTQTIAAANAVKVPAGRVLTLTGGFSDGLPRVGLPTATTQKAYGVSLRTHGGVRDRGDTDTFIDSGASLTLLSIGQIAMEFEAIVNTSVAGSLYYRAAVSGPFPETGKLLYAASAPADCVALNGTVDSPIIQVSDGKLVGLVTLSI